MLPQQTSWRARQEIKTPGANLVAVCWLLLSCGMSIGWSAPPGSSADDGMSRTSKGEAKATESGFLRPSVRRSGGTLPGQGNSTGRGSNNREDISARLRRRLEVCDRIKVIALETGDAQLEAAASEVENQIWQWYLEEISHGSAGSGAVLNRAAGTVRRSAEVPAVGFSHSPSASEHTTLPRPLQEPLNTSPLPRENRATGRQAISPAAQELQHCFDRRDVHTIRGFSADSARGNIQRQEAVSPAWKTQRGAGTPEESP